VPRKSLSNHPSSQYVGRFAPSPTGELHFGSLVAAVGSFLQARHQHGTWLVRIDDLDPPRVVPGSAQRILDDLARFGMRSDRPVQFQSRRDRAYTFAIEQLTREGQLFACACTRSELPPGPYPGTCRNGLQAGIEGRSLRVRVQDTPIAFNDRVRGTVTENLALTSGDFIVKRADGLPAYQLAVVIDDAWQGVTEVVRGADLLDSTPRQIHLQQLLGLPQPAYMHLPVVLDEAGRKLSKRFGADPVSEQSTLEALGAALGFLGHEPPPHRDLEQRWAWALAHWDVSRIPGG